MDEASASMPMFSRIVEAGGRKLLDGGIADSIPLRFMEKQGYDKNVVIVTQPRDYVKHRNKAMPLLKLAYRKYPNLIKACAERHKMYNKELRYIRRSESEGRALVIAPPEKLPVGHIEHDTNVLQEVYRIGRMTGMENLDRIKSFIGK